MRAQVKALHQERAQAQANAEAENKQELNELASRLIAAKGEIGNLNGGAPNEQPTADQPPALFPTATISRGLTSRHDQGVGFMTGGRSGARRALAATSSSFPDGRLFDLNGSAALHPGLEPI